MIKQIGIFLIILIFFTGITFAGEISDSSSGLITHLKMDSVSGNIVSDSSNNDHSATCITEQCPTQTTGVFGNALKFDGVNDYLTILHSTELNPSNYTIALWFKSNDYSTNQILLTNPKTPYTTIRYFLNTFEGKLTGGYYCDSDWRLVQSTTLTTGEWYHATLTFDSTNNTITLYLNGEQADQKIVSCGLPTTTTPMAIGSYLEYYGNVTIDDVGIWNRVLNESEIVSLANQNSPENNCYNYAGENIVNVFDLVYIGSRIAGGEFTLSNLIELALNLGTNEACSAIEEPPSIENCSIGQVTTDCLCNGVEINSGYCCANGYSESSCETTANCIIGEEITEECLCQETTYSTGFCCATGHSVSACESGEITAEITATRINGMAPMAVFFEGTNSTDSQGKSIEANSQLDVEIAEYSWTFGDEHAYEGNPNNLEGFNSAHVFEEPGTYNVTLTIKDLMGNVDATTTSITVTSGSGNTYYVDASLGNNSYNGKCTEANGEGCGPWKTYDYALSQANNNLGVPKESKILFKRGQTFEQTQVVRLLNISDIAFGDYGDTEIAKPEIIFNGTRDGTGQDAMIYCAGFGSSGNANRLSFTDIKFNGNRSNQILSNYSPTDTRPCSDFLFLRASMINSTGNTITTEKKLDKLFIIDSELLDSGLTQHYGKVSHYAMLNTDVLRMPNNHGLYLSHVYKGVISGNHIKGVRACENSRHNLRIAGWVIDGNPTKNVLVSNNLLDGETDGCATWNIVHFGPNIEDGHEMYNVLFEKNTVINGRILLRVDGGYNNLIIRNNLLDNRVDVGEPPIMIKAPMYGNHGTKRLLFTNNTVIYRAENSVIRIADPEMEDIEISNNIFYLTRPTNYQGWWPRGIQIYDSQMLNETTIKNNLFYHTTFSPSWEYAFVLGETQSPKYTLSTFQEEYPEVAFNNLEANPLFTNFSNNDFTLQINSPAIDTGVNITNLNEDFANNPRPLGLGFDIGAFEIR